MDIIEIMNARIPKKLNDKAYKLSRTFEKRIVAGSDAHTIFEIQKYLLNGKVDIQGNESTYYIRTLSKGLGRYKKNGVMGLVNSGLHKVIRR